MTALSLRSFLLGCALIALSACSVPSPVPTATPAPTPVTVTEGPYTVSVTRAGEVWTYTVTTRGPGFASLEFSSTGRHTYLPRNCLLSLPAGSGWQPAQNQPGRLALRAREASGTADVIFGVDCSSETQARVVEGPYSSLRVTDARGEHVLVAPVQGPYAVGF